MNISDLLHSLEISIATIRAEVEMGEFKYTPDRRSKLAEIDLYLSDLTEIGGWA